MLRIKRSVEGSFSTVDYNAAEMSGTENQVKNLTNDQVMKMIAERKGVELEPQARPIEGFVSASKRSAAAAQLDDVEERVAKLRKVNATETGKTQRQPTTMMTMKLTLKMILMNFWGKAERKRQQKSLLQPRLLRPRESAPRQCLEQYFGAWLEWQRVAKERRPMLVH
jgi:hypothetical protein